MSTDTLPIGYQIVVALLGASFMLCFVWLDAMRRQRDSYRRMWEHEQNEAEHYRKQAAYWWSRWLKSVRRKEQP